MTTVVGLLYVLSFMVSLAFAHAMDVKVNMVAAFFLALMWITYIHAWTGSPQFFLVTIFSFLSHMSFVKIDRVWLPKYEKFL